MKGWEVVVKWHGKSPSAVSKVFRGRRSVKSSAYPLTRQNSDSTRASNRHEKLYGQESGRDEEESHPCPLQKLKQTNLDRVPATTSAFWNWPEGISPRTSPIPAAKNA